MELDFSIITKAGIHQTEVAKLIGTSRVTVNNYMNGRVQPKDENATKLRHLLRVLDKLVGAGKLPKLIHARDPKRAVMIEKIQGLMSASANT